MSLKILPNCITIFRFLIIPFLCCAIVFDYNSDKINVFFAAFFFLLAAISDFLDGFLARKLNAESDFGKCFDNIADKVLNISVIVIFVWLKIIWLVPAILAITREVLIASFREYNAINGVRVSVDISGKIKTTLQFISLFILIISLYNSRFDYLFSALGNVIFSISTAISIFSAGSYIKKYFILNYGK